MKNDLLDFGIERYKTTQMQRIQQAASRGYCWYTSGLIHYDKSVSFINKLHDLYGIALNDNQRSYRKRKGKCNSFLFLYPKKDSLYFLWWLLVTDGDGEAHKKEKLYSIHDNHHRLTWDQDYELVMLPRVNSKPRVTWRMTRACYEAWNDRIRKSVRQKYSNDQANQAAWSLRRIPGFSGIRDQVKKLNRLFQAEWNRVRNTQEDMPKVDFVGYVRALGSNKVKLSIVVKRLKKGKRPFPRIDKQTV